MYVYNPSGINYMHTFNLSEINFWLYWEIQTNFISSQAGNILHWTIYSFSKNFILFTFYFLICVDFFTTENFNVWKKQKNIRISKYPSPIFNNHQSISIDLKCHFYHLINLYIYLDTYLNTLLHSTLINVVINTWKLL